jgi:hypothetical protein
MNSVAVDNLNAPGNSVALERQSLLALLGVKLVRVLQCDTLKQIGRAQPERRVSPRRVTPSRTVPVARA